MDGIVCPFCGQNPILGPDGVGNNLLWHIADGQRLPHRLQHRCIGKTGSQRIDGQHPTGSQRWAVQRLEYRGGHIIADKVPGYGAVENVFLAVLELVGGEFLVKEGQGQPGGWVCHLDFRNVQTLADMGGAGGVHHHSLEAGRLVHLQLFNGDDFRSVLIAPGEMANQILQGVNI